MDQLIPSIQVIINSSTSNMSAFASFLWPILPFVFAITVAVAVIRFIIGFFNIYGASSEASDFPINWGVKAGNKFFHRE